MVPHRELLAASWMPSFLSEWWVPAIAAAATIPPLVLLYFLKLRRRPRTVPSTLLWKRAVEDLQVNAPFQKLRNNLLLLLQLLILLLAIIALAQPVLNISKRRESKLILLIDNSASMATREADGQTRLEIAREQARRMIDGMGEGQRAMVISFHDEARALGPFTDDRAELQRQIDAIRVTDRSTRHAARRGYRHAGQPGGARAAGAAVRRAHRGRRGGGRPPHRRRRLDDGLRCRRRDERQRRAGRFRGPARLREARAGAGVGAGVGDVTSMYAEQGDDKEWKLQCNPLYSHTWVITALI